MVTVSRFLNDHDIERFDLPKIDAEMAEFEMVQDLETMDWGRIR